jgi:hypothetical protein
MLPMCLLTSLLVSTTYLVYSCVSRFCACQHLPLLWLFYLTIAIVTRHPFTRFPLNFHINFHSAFKLSIFQKTKNPTLSGRVSVSYKVITFISCFQTYLSRFP